MLEYEVNELDNDFITCWCKYLLAGYNDSIVNDLEKLAEKGQINAIQNWYLFKDKGDNEKIDTILDNLSDLSYNDVFSKIRCYGTDDKTMNRINELYEYMDEEDPYLHSDKRLSDRAKEARREFDNIKIVKIYLSAIREAVSIAKRTNNYVLLEIANEMLQEFNDDLLNSEIMYSRDVLYQIYKNNKIVIKGIIKSLKQTKKKDIKELISNNPATVFTLVKAILLFNENHKYKKDAIEMLKELSSREYLVINNNQTR